MKIYPLSDFTSLFEISFALHILYPLIPQIQRAFIARSELVYRKMNEHLAFFETRLEENRAAMNSKENEFGKPDGVNTNWDSLPKSEKDEVKQIREDFHTREKHLNRVLSALRFHQSGYESSMQTIDKIGIDLSRKFIPISISVACLSLCFIVSAGFSPTRGFPLITLIPIILVSLLTMPFLLFLTYRRSKHEIGRVNFSVFSIHQVMGLYWDGKADDIELVEYDFIAKR